MKRGIAAFLLFCLLFGASGCNWLGYGYRWADELIYFKLDQYFDLNDEQENQLKPQIHQAVLWHKKNQLPLYEAFVTQIDEAAASGMTLAKLQAIFGRWAELREALLSKLVAPSASFLATTSTAQQQRLQSKLTEENKKLLAQLELPEAERRRVRIEWLTETLEDWVGSLNSQQTETLTEFVSNLPLQEELWIQSRLDRQTLFFEGLKQPSTRSLEALLLHLWVEVYRMDNSAEGQQRRAGQAAYHQLLLTLYQQMDPKQQVTLHEQLLDFKATLAELQELDD